ncbi:hypothetical protein [Salisediminibacterium beveridgei]|uniref:Uncharacterized protein n=1 Tax=Salisediminibacterium beveridgei TaxID=632773 RepID=A0A1D7R061_9BACI|nr:hypothetical protein [Salisediminibacterium beveridgei]AOM84647.1 hypothetical protein BBEV_3350 [Salisediminibacterium beveridgei]
MKWFNKENAERVMMFGFLMILYAFPMMYDVAYLWAYIAVVVIATLFGLEALVDPLKPKRRFLKKWYRNRKRSPHVNAAINSGVFFMHFTIGLFVFPLIIEGQVIPLLELHAATQLFLIAVTLLFTVGVAYLSIPMNERRYEEVIVRLENREEDVDFIKETD